MPGAPKAYVVRDEPAGSGRHPDQVHPALERAMPLDTVPNDTFRQADIPVDVLFGDGHWHPARLVARWPDRHGREVVQVEWSAEFATWTEEYLADPERIREA